MIDTRKLLWRGSMTGMWLCLAGVASPLAGQQDFSDVQIEAQHVAGSVYMLVGSGGNIGVSAGPDGALMVDDQFAPLADKIRAALRDMVGDPAHAELRFILNTHWHGDHVGGNTEFGPEAPIIAHDNVRERLATTTEFRGNPREPTPPEGLPVITFGERVSLHFNGEEIRAIHMPNGHTDGDAVVHFTGSNVVHMGDDFFAGRFPFVDLESGGSVAGMTQAVATVIETVPADAHIIPGHGPLSTIDDLRVYHRMLITTAAAVREQMESGRTLEQISERGLGEEWAEWGTGFINEESWIATVYESVSRGDN